MRVLFTTWAWPSHYFPMVPVAWALRAAGHEVRMTSQPDLLPTMRASGLPVTAIGRDLDVTAVYRTARELVEASGPPVAAGPPRAKAQRFSDHLAGRLESPNLVHGYQMLRDLEEESISMFRALWVTSPLARPWRLSLYGEVARAMLDDLMALVTSWRPDLIVYDPLTYAAPLVGKLRDIPVARNLFGPDVNYFTTSTGMAEVLDTFGLDDLDMLGTATIDPCPPSLQFSDEIGPLPRIRYSYVPYNGIAEVPTWLPDRPSRPRICLTWGTSIHRLLGDRAFLPGEVLRGCAKLADERDAELVLAIKASQRAMLPEVPSGVRVVESVPLDALLPTCQAIVHQGGAGTMLTALRHGLPQIVLPQLFDEAANAFQIVATGAGLMRGAAELTAGEMLAAGHELLDDPAYRAGASRLRQEILELPSPASAVADLVALARR
jgi:UDP:flavonoid glycosyltransferase YjiC (YdhE family)